MKLIFIACILGFVAGLFILKTSNFTEYKPKPWHFPTRKFGRYQYWMDSSIREAINEK